MSHLPGALIAPPVSWSIAKPVRWLLAAPLMIYFVATILQTLASMKNAGAVRALLAWPLLVASHVFYGLGFWRGLFTKLDANANKVRTEVVLENIAR